MCGRYVSSEEAAIERAVEIQRRSWTSRFRSQGLFGTRYNVSPTDPVPVVRVVREIDCCCVLPYYIWYSYAGQWLWPITLSPALVDATQDQARIYGRQQHRSRFDSNRRSSDRHANELGCAGVQSLSYSQDGGAIFA
jgi:hypothetical protein